MKNSRKHLLGQQPNVPTYLLKLSANTVLIQCAATMTEMLTVGICFYTESYKTSTNYSAYTKHLVVAT